jgi:hypothetical protein
VFLSEISPIGWSEPIQKETQNPTRPIKQPYRIRTDAKYICPLDAPSSRALYMTPSECAKRASYPDPPPSVPSPLSKCQRLTL